MVIYGYELIDNFGNYLIGFRLVCADAELCFGPALFHVVLLFVSESVRHFCNDFFSYVLVCPRL